MGVSRNLFFKILRFSQGTSSDLMSLHNSSNCSIKSVYSISVDGMANWKLDKRDSSCLLSLYLEKLKITVLGHC